MSHINNSIRLLSDELFHNSYMIRYIKIQYFHFKLSFREADVFCGEFASASPALFTILISEDDAMFPDTSLEKLETMFR